MRFYEKCFGTFFLHFEVKKESYKCPLWASGEWLVIYFLRSFWQFYLMVENRKLCTAPGGEKCFLLVQIINPISLTSNLESVFSLERTFSIFFLKTIIYPCLFISINIITSFPTWFGLFTKKLISIDFYRARIRKQSNCAAWYDNFRQVL